MDSPNTALNRNLDSVGSWIDAYFESLVKISAETGQRESLALKRSNFPKALYRYRSLEGLARILEELRDGYVFLSNPAEFNDPYDSALSVSWEHLQMQVMTKFAPAYGYDPNTECKFFESLGEKEKEEWRVQQEFEQQAGESLLRGILSLVCGAGTSPNNHDFLSRIRNLVRVSCFTKNPSSVLMWSHYANQHKGICVEFPDSAMLASAKVLELLHPVRYTERLLDLFQLLYPSTAAEPSPLPPDIWPILAACQKSEEWRYEEEWRWRNAEISLRDGYTGGPEHSKPRESGRNRRRVYDDLLPRPGGRT